MLSPIIKRLLRRPDRSDKENWHLDEVLGTRARKKPSRVVRIGLIDSGINASRLNLAPSTIRYAEAAKGRISCPLAPRDQHPREHGTAVAALICSDLAGLLPLDCDLAVCGLEVDPGTCPPSILDYPENFAAAMDWMSSTAFGDDHVPDVVVCSSGVDLDSDVVADAVENAVKKHIILVASAGNGGPVLYPARYDDVISVGATDKQQTVWPNTSHDSQNPTVFAPGVDVRTIVNGAIGPATGTSFSSPIAGAACAWIKLELSAKGSSNHFTPKSLIHALVGASGNPTSYVRIGSSGGLPLDARIIDTTQHPDHNTP